MKTGFGILLEGPAFNLVRELELDLCERFGLCWGLRQPPHVTVKGPFEIDAWGPVTQYLEKVSAEIAPFDIELRGFGHFGDAVIFHDVVESNALQDLHYQFVNDARRLFSAAPRPFEKENVKFHATLALEDVAPPAFERAWDYLQTIESPPIVTVARAIGLFAILPENAGNIIVRQVPFGGGG